MDRLDRIEARQRAYGMHDPDCPRFRTEQIQKNTGAYIVPRDCTCWLTQPVEGGPRDNP